MGRFAAQCISGVGHQLGGSFAFEIFGHITRFFGYKVHTLQQAMKKPIK
jgi:hypothetical protein